MLTHRKDYSLWPTSTYVLCPHFTKLSLTTDGYVIQLLLIKNISDKKFQMALVLSALVLSVVEKERNRRRQKILEKHMGEIIKTTVTSCKVEKFQGFPETLSKVGR